MYRLQIDTIQNGHYTDEPHTYIDVFYANGHFAKRHHTDGNYSYGHHSNGHNTNGHNVFLADTIYRRAPYVYNAATMQIMHNANGRYMD